MTTTPLPPPVPLTGLDCYIDPKDGKVKRYDQARADLEAENQRLRTLLAEAADDIESWGAYASDYFQKKHDLSGCVAKYRAALKGINHD